jgi:RNA polymerase sigma-70 factor (ECF subfamily)
MDALAPDVVLIADGGGVAVAVRQPVVGAKKVVNLLGGFARIAPTASIEPVLLNGAPGASILLEGAVDTVIGFAFDGGRISRLLAVRNPEKLRRLTEETQLTR